MKIKSAISLILVLNFVSLQCGREELPPPDNYKNFIEVSADLMCRKMMKCYEKLYRTVSQEARRKITSENCRKTVLVDLDSKLEKHTPKMKLLSVQCYQKILDTPCNKFAEISMFAPECMSLRIESIAAYNR
ncbi:MAG: hypothetical protein OEZ34_10840 [Spirochaetia bacterium]|nr:hypothetical protein [Spirochaetia bacterium]